MDTAHQQLGMLRRKRSKRRSTPVQEGHGVEEDSVRQADVETAGWDLNAATGHYGCTTVMMFSSNQR